MGSIEELNHLLFLFFFGTHVLITSCSTIPDYRHSHHHQVSLTRTAMCKAHCVTSLMTSSMSDTDCIHSADCATCWLTCESLVSSPRDHVFMCGSRYSMFCSRGCHTACDVIKPHTHRRVISAEYNKWSFGQMAEVEIVTPYIAGLSWQRPIEEEETFDEKREIDQVIIYTIMQRSSRHATWRQLHSTTQLLAAVNVVHEGQGDLYYRILAVTNDGLIADMDVTVLHQDLVLLQQHAVNNIKNQTTEPQQDENKMTDIPFVDSMESSKTIVAKKSGLSTSHYYLILAGCLLIPLIPCLVTVIMCRKRERTLDRSSFDGNTSDVSALEETCDIDFEDKDMGGGSIFKPRDPLLKKKIELQTSQDEKTQIAINAAYHNYLTEIKGCKVIQA